LRKVRLPKSSYVIWNVGLVLVDHDCGISPPVIRSAIIGTAVFLNTDMSNSPYLDQGPASYASRNCAAVSAPSRCVERRAD
jgi:hypothetical protein